MATCTDEIKVCFLGNSIQYFNDSPRLLEQMLQVKFRTVKQDSCFRAGASITTLWTQGNGMQAKFTSINPHSDIGAASVEELLSSQEWDYAVINDFTQGPARESSRSESAATLKRFYYPLLAKSNTVPIFLQTAAYKSPVMGSEDLGSVEEFTQSIDEGYHFYSALWSQQYPTRTSAVAPVGQAFLVVHDRDRMLWEKLFYMDDLHPSPHGTWLQACVLYCILVGEIPPAYNPQWWKKARFMMPDVQMEVPNQSDAETLRQIAVEVYGLDKTYCS